MRDVELLTRYIAFHYFLDEYNGSMKSFLDNTSNTLNTDWDRMEHDIRTQVSRLEQTHLLLKSVFKSNVYRKWLGAKYESRFNRAIFDIMVFYFSKLNTIQIAGLEENIEDEYKLLFNDSRFIEAIGTTTKSLENTVYRLTKFATMLNKVLSVNLPTYKIVNKRIVEE